MVFRISYPNITHSQKFHSLTISIPSLLSSLPLILLHPFFGFTRIRILILHREKGKTVKRGWETHLLNTRRNQGPIISKHMLHHHAPPIATPRTRHLGKHPLIRAKASRLMEVDRVIQTHHHTYLRPAFLIMQIIAVAFSNLEILDVLFAREGFRRAVGVGSLGSGFSKTPEVVDA